MSLIEVLTICFIAALLTALALVGYDTVTATPARIEHCTVIDKGHEDAWDQVTYDANDHTFSTIHHEAQWWIVVNSSRTISVSEGQWQIVKIGQPIDIMVSIGGLGGEHRKIAPPIEQ